MVNLANAAPRWATPRLRQATDGPFAREFIESFCRDSKSGGKLLKLRPWQGYLVDDLLELNADGSRRHRQGLIGVARKNGKSLVGSALGLWGLVGEGLHGAEVYSCAGTKQQARIVFDEACRMVRAEPELDDALTIYRNGVIEYPALQAVWRVLSAEAFSAEGLNPSLVIFDEVHVQRTWDLWNVMTQGSATRRSPLTLGITTAGYDTSTLCYWLYEYGRKIAAGEVDDPSFFLRWWEPRDPQCDYRDRSAWAEANPGLGDFQYVEDFEAAARKVAEGGQEAAFRRYRLNQWTAAAESWLPHGVWGKRAESGLVVPGLAELREALDAIGV